MIDNAATGKSDGRYISFGVKESEVLCDWFGFINEAFGKDIKIILYGVSMGAATINNLFSFEGFNKSKNIKFIISDCSFTSPWELFRFSLKKVHWPSFPLLQGVTLFNRIINGFSFRTCRTPLTSVQKIKHPVLFIHGKRDSVVPSYMSEKLFEKCTSPDKELFIVENAPHCAAYLKASEEYEEKINKLIDKYL